MRNIMKQVFKESSGVPQKQSFIEIQQLKEKKMKISNFKMEIMLNKLKPILHHRNKIGYVAARNIRILNGILTEYFAFKHDLISKYGEPDKDNNGNETGSISISPDSSNFKKFIDEFDVIKNIEHDVDLMQIPYEEAIGILNGEELLDLDWMFID